MASDGTKGFSLRLTITIYAVVMSIIALALASSITFALFNSQFKQTISDQQFALVASLAHQIDDRLALAQSLLATLGSKIGPTDLNDPEKIQRILDAEDGARSMFDGGFLVLGPHMDLVAQSPSMAGRHGMDYGFHDYVRRTFKTGTPVISNPYRADYPPHDPYITFTFPIRNSSGETVGLLAAQHNLIKGSLLSPASKDTNRNSGYRFIISHERTLVAHPDKARIMEVIKPGVNMGIDRALNHIEGAFENTNSHGVAGITSFKHLQQADWIVASHVPLNDIYHPLRTTEEKVVIACILIALASGLIIWRVLGMFTAPLQNVIDHIGSMHIKKGRDRMLPDTLRGDLGKLGTVLNTMVEDFDTQQQALLAAQETYRIVAEFTAEVAFWREPDGATRFISPNCLDLTGYRDSEFYAEADLLDRVIHPDFREKWARHRHERDEATGAIRHTELKIARKDGQERWVTHLCHKVYNEQGRLLGVRGNFTDITLIRRMQAEMRNQRAFAEELINKAAVPIFVLDTAHRIIVWNTAMENLTGLKAEEMLGTTRQWEPFYQNRRPVLADFILSGDKVHLDQIYGSFRLSQHVLGGLQSEGWYDGINGQRRYLCFDAAPVYDKNDCKVAAIETMLDFTERKLAEEEQRILSWAVDNNPNSIVITDPGGTIEYVNHKFCSLTGYSAAEAIGQTPRMLKSGEMPPEQYAELWQIISHGGNWHGEFHNKKKSGELYWESASIAPILDDQGRILRYLSVKEDITQRKIYESELLNNTEELLLKHSELNAMFSLVNIGKREWEDTMDSIPEMVLMCDPSGAITRCNRAVTTFTGLSYNQILGLNCLKLLVRSGMEVISCDDTNGQMSYAGGTRHFELLFNELKQIGTNDVRGSVVTIHETTEFLRVNEDLRKASIELQQAQAQAFQQEKMASIGQLAAGVAHEINNPMGFISSNLNTMGKYMQKLGAFETEVIEAVQNRGDQETVALLNDVRARMKIDFILNDLHTLLEESRDGAERVRCIVRDLKSFSHEDEAQCKPFSINECLDSTLNMARNEIKYVADVVRDYDPALPLLNCYPQKLNQVFMNLLVNAAHAIDGHGTICIRTFSEGGDIVVSISDTGKGIAPENLTRIFEPFFTTKEVGKGTGLGLSISYDIIKNHGGIMTVESEVGAGTTFTVRLPLNHTAGM
jgi:two-component system NtrC family sensor kinase